MFACTLRATLLKICFSWSALNSEWELEEIPIFFACSTLSLRADKFNVFFVCDAEAKAAEEWLSCGKSWSLDCYIKFCDLVFRADWRENWIGKKIQYPRRIREHSQIATRLVNPARLSIGMRGPKISTHLENLFNKTFRLIFISSIALNTRISWFMRLSCSRTHL